MLPRFSSLIGRARATTLLLVPISFSLGAPGVSAQDHTFDMDVARIGTGSRFSPFLVTETEPLAEALDAGRLQDDTRVLVMEHPAGYLAFLTDQMAFHHVAQGDIAGEPWMVSF